MGCEQMIPIGNLFNIEKGELQSTKCTPGDYDFVTAAEDWKTHNEYAHECEALIFAAAASGSLGRTHHVNGKFTTSDLCYILTPKDEAKYPLNLSFYHFVFNSLRPTLVAATKSGTSKESINQNNFKNYEIPYFDIDLQDFWIEKLKNTLGLKDLLGSELTHQQTLLKKFRQQILQDAIEGKLTADWRAQNPDIEPASELLKRIAAEKEQLIKDKKIKAQKPLPPIRDEEKPFELPVGWVWCRLVDVTQIKGGKRVSNGYKLLKTKTPYVYIRVSDMSNQTISDDDLYYIDSDMRKIIERYIITKDDLYIVIVGATIGKCGVVPPKFDGMNLTENAARIIIHCIDKQYLLWLMNSRYCQSQFLDKTKRVGVQKMALNRLETSALPIPSLEEQQAIVTKLEKLLTLCDELETQITQNKTHAEQLMQAVLKEAFSDNQAE